MAHLMQLRPQTAEVDEIAARFGGIIDAVKAVTTAEGATEAKWRVAADRFYSDFIVNYYDFQKSEVAPAARSFIEKATGSYKDAEQDKLKLATACRFFFGREASRQDINRLAYLGAAGANYGMKPSEVIDSVGEGSINKAVNAFRKVINPESDAEKKERERDRKEKAINDLFGVSRADFLDKALSDPGIVNVITMSHRHLMADIVEHVVESGTEGRKVEGVTLSINASGKAAIEGQLARIGIADGDGGIINVKRVGSTFEVIWSEMPEPEEVGQV